MRRRSFPTEREVRLSIIWCATRAGTLGPRKILFLVSLSLLCMQDRPSHDTTAVLVCWFGINDLAHNMSSAGRSLYTTEAQLLLLFELHAALYKRGARNFLIINVPPVHASPGESPCLDLATDTPLILVHEAWQRSADASQLRIRDWNTKLQKVADQFCSAHPAATVLIFSSWDCLNAVFDEPRKHGFDPSDVERPYGGIWVDNLHLTSNVHDFIARDVYQFLESVQAGG